MKIEFWNAICPLNFLNFISSRNLHTKLNLVFLLRIKTKWLWWVTSYNLCKRVSSLSHKYQHISRTSMLQKKHSIFVENNLLFIRQFNVTCCRELDTLFKKKKQGVLLFTTNWQEIHMDICRQEFTVNYLNEENCIYIEMNNMNV